MKLKWTTAGEIVGKILFAILIIALVTPIFSIAVAGLVGISIRMWQWAI